MADLFTAFICAVIALYCNAFAFGFNAGSEWQRRQKPSRGVQPHG
jgi:hypothetical protein